MPKPGPELEPKPNPMHTVTLPLSLRLTLTPVATLNHPHPSPTLNPTPRPIPTLKPIPTPRPIPTLKPIPTPNRCVRDLAAGEQHTILRYTPDPNPNLSTLSLTYLTLTLTNPNPNTSHHPAGFVPAGSLTSIRIQARTEVNFPAHPIKFTSSNGNQITTRKMEQRVILLEQSSDCNLILRKMLHSQQTLLQQKSISMGKCSQPSLNIDVVMWLQLIPLRGENLSESYIKTNNKLESDCRDKRWTVIPVYVEVATLGHVNTSRV